MIARGWHFALLALFTATLPACTSSEQLRAPDEPGQTTVVLLPDPESAKVGRANAANSSGSVDLYVARASTTVTNGRPPAMPVVMSEAELQRLFGETLSALPPAPKQFVLYFKFESDELTDASRALIPEVVTAVSARPGPEVTIVGHTDTTGAPAANFQLGMRRATAVRGILVTAGLDPTLVDLKSHGEMDPLVSTSDNVAEPQNRRVEISVR